MNPIELLNKHCNFENKHDCYVLLAVSRKKDTPSITNSKEIIFRDVIKKKEDIVRKYNSIKASITNYKDETGKSFPFYLYVSLNARDAKKATVLLMNKIIDWFDQETNGVDCSRMFKKIHGHFYSQLMKPASRTKGQRYFMIDFDEDDEIKMNMFVNTLETNQPYIEVKLIQKTKNGYHIKTKPFDRRIFDEIKNKSELDCEIKTDANFFVEYFPNINKPKGQCIKEIIVDEMGGFSSEDEIKLMDEIKDGFVKRIKNEN